ncbi:MAG: polysaccharide deacetylase family protein [Planctomycetota bacterium]|jgi:polysaccharide deacetylase family protein (PEP-CTERM system associated)
MNREERASMIIISVDLDEWYHCRCATGSSNSIWCDTQTFFKEHYGTDQPIGELVKPTEIILKMFDEYGMKATFFILGEVAGFYPDLVKEISRRGHEIACHGLRHVDLYSLSKAQFVDELKQAKDTLESLIQKQVIGYRAPNLITELWVLDVLENLGFEYDSSVCPSRPLMGKFRDVSQAPQNPYRPSVNSLTTPGDHKIVEMPIPTFPILKLPAATGIMTRVIGRRWTTIALKHALKTGMAAYYFHPFELAPRPNITRLSLYHRLFFRRAGEWMEKALDVLFREFNGRFISCQEAARRFATHES